MTPQIKIPKGWRRVVHPANERRGDRISYDNGKTWKKSEAWRWGSPVAIGVITTRRITRRRIRELEGAE